MDNVLRAVNGYELNQGYGMAKGLFNLTHESLNVASLWFDEEERDELLEMSDIEFEDYAKENTD